MPRCNRFSRWGLTSTDDPNELYLSCKRVSDLTRVIYGRSGRGGRAGVADCPADPAHKAQEPARGSKGKSVTILVSCEALVDPRCEWVNCNELGRKHDEARHQSSHRVAPDLHSDNFNGFTSTVARQRWSVGSYEEDHFIHLYMYSTWRHSTGSKDPRPVTVVEDPFSDHPKERTRQHVRRGDVEGYLAYRIDETQGNVAQQRGVENLGN